MKDDGPCLDRQPIKKAPTFRSGQCAQEQSRTADTGIFSAEKTIWQTGVFFRFFFGYSRLELEPSPHESTPVPVNAVELGQKSDNGFLGTRSSLPVADKGKHLDSTRTVVDLWQMEILP